MSCAWADLHTVLPDTDGVCLLPALRLLRLLPRREAGITLVLSGHDHNSDWCGRLDGVRLCYGRKSG